MIATPNRLLHFFGKIGRTGSEGSGPIFPRLFASEEPIVHEVTAGQVQVPSVLAVTPDTPLTPSSEKTSPERIFAWRYSQGLFHGRLLLSPPNQDLGNKTFAEARTIIGPTNSQPNGRGSQTVSASSSTNLVALTQWHVLRLIDNRVVATNRLDDSIVYDQAVVDARQKPLALLADLKKNTFWLFTTNAIFEIIVENEDRDIWKVLLKAQKFEGALQYANNAGQKDAVATASGDFLISNGRYLEAASVYGRSSKPFEQVALIFIDYEERDALRKYLLTKLAVLKKSDLMQRIMISSWLVEVFMSKLNSLDDTVTAKADLGVQSTMLDVNTEMASVKKEFHDFLRRSKDDLDRKTVYDIISSHDREDELLQFATTINDHNFVLAYWVQREEWAMALKALNRQTDSELTYKYGSVLMKHVPTDFVEVLMRQENIDPRKLIPACLNYNDSIILPLSQNQAVRYLLFEINSHGSTDSAVHNTLISIYASHPSRDESALLNYLGSQTPESDFSPRIPKDQNFTLPYDADFALRLCIQNERVRSCVHIFTTMGQYTSAVALALQHDETEIATAVAEKPEHDAPTRKKLWLAIARSIIDSPIHKPEPITGQNRKSRTEHNEINSTSSTGIKTALTLLQRAPPGVLRIEDLLPLFPDFVLVDAFREEICTALDSYSQHIDTLKREMDDSSATASRIKSDVATLNKRWVLLEPSQSCGICWQVLLERRFWVWQCGHGIHSDCLAREVVKKSSKAVNARVKDIRSSLESGAEGKRRETLVAELDDILGKDCPLCGEMAIRFVDEPFVSPNESSKSWAL